MLTIPSTHQFLRRSVRLVLGLVIFAVCSGLNCDLSQIIPPGNGLTITATPTGCGVKVDDFKTISWVVTFTATGAADSNGGYQWFFSDGTSGTGQTVVKTFDTAARENAAAGDPFADTSEHDPVDFDVTVTVGSESATQTFGLPLRGTPDGGPEPGDDTCTVDDGRKHVAVGTQLCYTQNPTATGPHYSQPGTAPIPPGFYDEAIATERWVHNLEHGSVVLLYDCGGDCPDSLKTQLQDFFDSLPESERFHEQKMVITRYAGVEPACTDNSTFPASGSFLAIAWGVQHAFADFDEQGILDFYNRHVDHGPEDEPIPAP